MVVFRVPFSPRIPKILDGFEVQIVDGQYVSTALGEAADGHGLHTPHSKRFLGTLAVGS